MTMDPIIALTYSEATVARYSAGLLALIGAAVAWRMELGRWSGGLRGPSRSMVGGGGAARFHWWYFLLLVAGPLGWLLLAWLFVRSRQSRSSVAAPAERVARGAAFRFHFAWLGLVIYGASITWLWWMMDHASDPLDYAENRGRLYLDLGVEVAALPVSAVVEFVHEKFADLSVDHSLVFWYAAPPLFGLICGFWLDLAFFAGRRGVGLLKVGMIAALLVAVLGLAGAERSRQSDDAAVDLAAGAFTDGVLARVSDGAPRDRRLEDQWILQRHLSGDLGGSSASSVFGEIAEVNLAAAALIAVAPVPFTEDSFFQNYPGADRDQDALARGEMDFTIIGSRWDDLVSRISESGGEIPWDHEIPKVLDSIGARLAAFRELADIPPEEAAPPAGLLPTDELTDDEDGAIALVFGKEDGRVISREDLDRGEQILKMSLSDTSDVNAFLRRGWDDLGMRVDGISGSADGWAVLMSERTAHGVEIEQQVLHEVDQTAIADAFSKGMKITALDGHRDHWMVVLSRVSGYGEQRFTSPTPFDAARLDWLTKRVGEGFQLTAVGGMDDPGIEDDGWIFVVTKGLSKAEQIVLGPGDWPTASLTTLKAEGYRVTAAAGGPGRWLLVMTRAEGAAQQFQNVTR